MRRALYASVLLHHGAYPNRNATEWCLPCAYAKAGMAARLAGFFARGGFSGTFEAGNAV